jgi:hypothetical protein
MALAITGLDISFHLSGAYGANICKYLGTVEEYQGSMVEDQIYNLENDPDKPRTFKTSTHICGHT